MSLDEKLNRIRTLIAQRDEIDRELEGIIGHYGSQSKATSDSGGNAVRKRRGPKVSSKKVDSDLMQEVSRRHPATDEIEQMMIEGATVAEVLEKVEVSSPTVYLIKARLKRDGKLS